MELVTKSNITKQDNVILFFLTVLTFCWHCFKICLLNMEIEGGVRNMNRIIETERMILRPINKNDAKDIFEWVSDPIVNKYMPYNLYENIEQVEECMVQVLVRLYIALLKQQKQTI